MHNFGPFKSAIDISRCLKSFVKIFFHNNLNIFNEIYYTSIIVVYNDNSMFLYYCDLPIKNIIILEI